MGDDGRVAVLLVGYGEVEEYQHFAAYNEMALKLLAAKFLRIPGFAFKPLGSLLARSDRREWSARDNFRSPHNEIFEAQRAGIARTLAERYGDRVEVFKAFNFCEPELPAQVLARIRARGFRRLVLVPLLVIDSVFTGGLALQQVNEALAEEERWLAELRYLPSFYERPDYHRRLETYLEGHLAAIERRHQRSRIGVVLINHGSPYEVKGFTTGIEESVYLYERVRERLARRWPLVSVGWLNHDTPGRWTSPDVAQASRNLLALGASTLVYFPIGFVTENHETILDVEAIIAPFERQGIPCTRVNCLNDDPEFLTMAAAWVAELVDELVEDSLRRPLPSLREQV